MYFYDTNALLELQDKIFEEEFYISQQSLIELEEIKTNRNKDEDIKFKARHIARQLWNNKESYEVVYITKDLTDALSERSIPVNPDNIIVISAFLIKNKLHKTNKDNEFVFVTNDINCALMAKNVFGLETRTVSESQSDQELYRGYKNIMLRDEDIAKIYDKNNLENICGLLVNEYGILHDNTDTVYDVVKWTENGYVSAYNKPFKSRQLGSIKALDPIQRVAFDSVVTNDITILYGRAGSGKTTVPLYYAMQALETGKRDRLYVVFSYETLKNQKTLGYVKGDIMEKKLNTSSIGGILASKFGDITEVQRLIQSGMLEIVATSDIRGVEYSADSVVICTEAQNLDNYALRTLIQRCKQGTKLILEGDILEQHDTNRDIGLFKMINIFKGHECFGCVKLKNNYRSAIGELADML